LSENGLANVHSSLWGAHGTEPKSTGRLPGTEKHFQIQNSEMPGNMLIQSDLFTLQKA
jgi:hypothetical protein